MGHHVKGLKRLAIGCFIFAALLCAMAFISPATTTTTILGAIPFIFLGITTGRIADAIQALDERLRRLEQGAPPNQPTPL